MTNLTNRPITQKPATEDKPKRYAFVACPYCELAGFACMVCNGTGKVKAEFIRFAPGSGRSKGTVKYKPGDKDWSYQVRERDGWKCRWCGKQHTPWHSEREGRLVCDTLDAAHLFRRSHGMTRQDLNDGFAMCSMSCHTYVDSHREEFHRWARAELGAEVYDDLGARSRQTKKRVKRA